MNMISWSTEFRSWEKYKTYTDNINVFIFIFYKQSEKILVENYELIYFDRF